MGGMGSGQWYRWSKKATTSDYKSIPISFIKKYASFEEGNYCSNTIRWSLNGEETGSVGYRVGYVRNVTLYAPYLFCRR